MSKIILITGATAGIGKETAKQLAAQGHLIYITGRDKSKCEQTLQELKQINAAAAGGCFLSDFADLSSVRKMANEINSTLPQLDVLINNAGGVFAKHELTPEGYEKTFCVNHLSPFLLTNLLLPLLQKSNAARIVTVASDSHYRGSLDFNDLHFEKNYFILKAYERSKLCNVLFSNHLAKQLKGTDVISNSLHPGHVVSDIGAKTSNPFFKWVWKTVNNLTGIPTAEGAKTSVYLATAEEATSCNGLYFDKCKAKTPSKLAQDEQLAEQLWEVSKNMVGI